MKSISSNWKTLMQLRMQVKMKGSLKPAEQTPIQKDKVNEKGGNRKMNGQVQTILNRLKELWFIPFTVYAIGFIFVQGLFAPYYNDLFIINNFLRAQPISYSMYLINGIYVFFVVGVGAGLAYSAAAAIPARLINLLKRQKIWFNACLIFGILLCGGSVVLPNELG
ncbi:hypothetical protein OMP38_17025 [Cohnella ginsengisoli]|uniref:Uncharacterized protein n=1 Tax=Cohnella ginsengisoli TaxID=425004 RepID=A0A9X4KHR5_9BACL|nr:hypothetical protein [Cohnella ginsengisoli]MDG0792383.1 hypothetical protein [Cohnella ginsengisoli]